VKRVFCDEIIFITFSNTSRMKPEQRARVQIDSLLTAAAWQVHDQFEFVNANI
jgi:hypothetical protein